VPVLVALGVFAPAARARAANDAEEPRVMPPSAASEPAEPEEAQAEAEHVPTRPHDSAVYIATGLGTPVGAWGFEGVHRILPMLELSGGFGLGGSAMSYQKDAGFTHVVQWAVMPRLRLGEAHAFTFGAGASGGRYAGIFPCGFEDESPSTCNPPTAYVIWLNVEIGGEHWFSGGFALRYFLGLASGKAVDGQVNSAGELQIPYFGIGLGYAF